LDRFAFGTLIFVELNDECSERGKICARRKTIYMLKEIQLMK